MIKSNLLIIVKLPKMGLWVSFAITVVECRNLKLFRHFGISNSCHEMLVLESVKSYQSLSIRNVSGNERVHFMCELCWCFLWDCGLWMVFPYTRQTPFVSFEAQLVWYRLCGSFLSLCDRWMRVVTFQHFVNRNGESWDLFSQAKLEATNDADVQV